MNALIEKLGHQIDAAADDKDAERLLDLSQQCQESDYGFTPTDDLEVLQSDSAFGLRIR